VKLARNSLYSLLGTAFPTLVSLATIPLFVSQIGASRYGAITIAWLVLGYFGAADFGLGRAIMQRVAAMRGQASAAMARSVWTALVSMSLFGVLGAFILYLFANWYFAGPFKVEEGLRYEITASVWILALCNPLVAINGVLSGALMGLERFKLVSISTAIANSSLLLFPLATAYFITIDLSALVLSALLARLLGTVILSFGLWRTFLKGQPVTFSLSEMRHLASFGAWVMVTALVGPLMVFADRFLIGVLQDAVAVAAYAIPFQIASRTVMIPIAIAQALFPRFASEGAEASKERCRQFTIFIGLLFAPIIVVLICLAEPLLGLWLGVELDPRSVLVAHVLLAGFWTNALATIPFGYIQARGDPRFTALLHVAELPIYALLLLGLGLNFGLAGFALAFSLRCTIDCIALLWRADAMGVQTWARLAGPIATILLALSSTTLQPSLLLQLAITALLATLAILLLVFSSPEAIRDRVLNMLPLKHDWGQNGRG